MIKPVKFEEKQEEKNSAEIRYLTDGQPRWGEKLARNIALAGMLVLTITAIRNDRLPTGETVLTAVQEMIDSNWDERLGKISFVSHMLPDTVAVFFETELQTPLTAPCFGSVDHAWAENEPYIGYQSDDNRVYAAAEGQVMSIAHGLDEERIVRIRHDDGIETMYYNLAETSVAEGELVTEQTCIGEAFPDQQVLIEVRRAGRAIDPTSLLSPREKEKQ